MHLSETVQAATGAFRALNDALGAAPSDTIPIPVGELRALLDAASATFVGQGRPPTVQRLLNVVSAICTTERIGRD